MGFYSSYVLPRLINVVMNNEQTESNRAQWVPLATGRVLEVGIGSGLNLPFYGPDIEALIGLDPSGELWRLGQHRIEAAPFPVERLGHSAERMPLEDDSFDTVVTTWTLCSIPDAGAALREMRRVLKPSGRLIFIEHGLAPETGVQTWQNRLNPFWKRVAGGCNINRKIDALMSAAQFRITQLETGYLKGPKPMSFHYKGIATP